MATKYGPDETDIKNGCGLTEFVRRGIISKRISDFKLSFLECISFYILWGWTFSSVLVARYLLLVARYFLLVASYFLSVARYFLLVARYLFPDFYGQLPDY